MNIFIMNRYISKSYTRSKNTIYRAGAAVVSTITSFIIIRQGAPLGLVVDELICIKVSHN